MIVRCMQSWCPLLWWRPVENLENQCTDALPATMADKLTTLNIVNVITYLANTGATYGSQLGWFGATNTAQSLKYQTLVTPIGFAFAIWGPIFILQALFTVAQLLPGYRSDPAVQQGVGYWYCAASLAQLGWTVSFAQDVIWLSMIFMLMILFSLGALLHSLGRVAAEAALPRLRLRYTLLHAPFLMHFGWITAASFVNVNVCIVKYAATNTQLQLGAAVASIALLLLPGLYNPATLSAQVAGASADPLYSLVVVWAFYGVHKELAKPTLEGALKGWCPPLVSGALCGVAALMSALLLTVVVVRLVRLMLATLRDRGSVDRLGMGASGMGAYPRFEDRSEHAAPGKL